MWIGLHPPPQFVVWHRAFEVKVVTAADPNRHHSRVGRLVVEQPIAAIVFIGVDEGQRSDCPHGGQPVALVGPLHLDGCRNLFARRLAGHGGVHPQEAIRCRSRRGVVGGKPTAAVIGIKSHEPHSRLDGCTFYDKQELVVDIVLVSQALLGEGAEAAQRIVEVARIGQSADLTAQRQTWILAIRRGDHKGNARGHAQHHQQDHPFGDQPTLGSTEQGLPVRMDQPSQHHPPQQRQGQGEWHPIREIAQLADRQGSRCPKQDG